MIIGNLDNLTAPVRTINGKVDVIDTSTEAATGKAVRLEGCTVGAPLEVTVTSNTGVIPTNTTRKSRNLIDTKSGISYIKYLTSDGTGERARYGWVLDLPPGNYCAHGENINYTGGYIYLMIVKADNFQLIGESKYLANGGALQHFAGAFTLAEGQKALLLDYTTSHTQADAEKLFYEDTNFQVEEGSLPTAYEPFGEVQTGAAVLQYGKNIFDYKTYPLTNHYWHKTTGKPTAANTYSCTMLIPCAHLQGKTITQNVAVHDVASGGNGGVAFFTNNTSEGYIKETGTNENTYTVPNNAIYMGITVPRANADGASVQIEIGESITDFEPYKEPKEYAAAANGVVEGVTAYSVNTLVARNEETTLTAAYSVDIEGDTYTNHDKLKSIKLDRTATSKFFGFGISQKATVVLVDKECTCGLEKGDKLTISFDDIKVSPLMYITDVKRNEVNGEVTVTTFDAINNATQYTVASLELESYTIAQLLEAIAAKLKLVAIYPNIDAFGLLYEDGANFDGTETLRAVLDAIAEATQTIYYVNRNNEIVFTRLDKSGEAVLTIDKTQYYKLDSKENKTLTAICSATELGDNVEETTGAIGVTQYVRDNPLWETREDIGDLVIAAIGEVGGTQAAPFNCEWRGNYLLEPTDKIALVKKDDTIIYSYLINDTIDYAGGFKQVSNWEYAEEEKQHSNPATLGEVLKQTYAKVDKVNKDITLVASEANDNAAQISALQLNTKSINASVSSLQTKTDKALESLNGEVSTLTKKVNATITDKDVTLLIEEQLANGVESVETSTGFTFNKDGLTVGKSDSDISTTITEDGMDIYKGAKTEENKVLSANNEGVTAKDLHAKTYLIIGTNSRFENYDNNKRTGCFWIG